MKCPVCHGEGADNQPVGPSVTVFCCPRCLTTVLNTFAQHRTPPPRRVPVEAAAS